MDVSMTKEVKTPSVPESVTAHSNEEIYEMLEVGMKQIRAGKVFDAEDVMARLKGEYGFSG